MAVNKEVYYQIALDLLASHNINLEDVKVEVFRESGSGLQDVVQFEGSAIRLSTTYPRLGLLRTEWRDERTREQNFMVAVCLLLDKILQGSQAYYEG